MASSGKPDGRYQILSRRMARMFPFDELYDENTKYAEEVGCNAYHQLANPEGVINLATAFSYICDDLMAQKFACPDMFEASAEYKVWHIAPSCGDIGLREAFAAFCNRRLKPARPILAHDLIVINGVTSALDYLSHCIADPGDTILIPTPSYAYLQRNVRLRAEVEFWPVDLFSEDESIPFQLTPEKVESAIKAAKNAGKNVRGMIIVNPSNPLGDVYSPRLITAILEICKSYSIHPIIDEITAQTVFGEGVQFESCVSYKSIPDPQRTHVIWSMSKDFSFSGSRIAFVYSLGKEVFTSLSKLSYFFLPPTLQQRVCMRLVKDEVWCDETYFPTLANRLRQAHSLVQRRLTDAGVVVRPASSGFVFLANFSNILRKKSFEEEKAVFQSLLDAGVFITPCRLMHCSQPGWFRIVFAHPDQILQTAMDRIELGLEIYRTSRLTA